MINYLNEIRKLEKLLTGIGPVTSALPKINSAFSTFCPLCGNVDFIGFFKISFFESFLFMVLCFVCLVL